jgi:hypothetical protein
MLELHHCKRLLCYYELLNLGATSWCEVYLVRGVCSSGSGTWCGGTWYCGAWYWCVAEWYVIVVASYVVVVASVRGTWYVVRGSGSGTCVGNLVLLFYRTMYYSIV